MYTHFTQEVGHHREPGSLFKVFIYVALTVLAVGTPLMIGSAIFGAETVTYWLADLFTK